MHDAFGVAAIWVLNKLNNLADIERIEDSQAFSHTDQEDTPEENAPFEDYYGSFEYLEEFW